MAKDGLQLFDERIVTLLRLLIGRSYEPLAPGVFRIHALHLFRDFGWMTIAPYQLVPGLDPVLPLLFRSGEIDA